MYGLIKDIPVEEVASFVLPGFMCPLRGWLLSVMSLMTGHVLPAHCHLTPVEWAGNFLHWDQLFPCLLSSISMHTFQVVPNMSCYGYNL